MVERKIDCRFQAQNTTFDCRHDPYHRWFGTLRDQSFLKLSNLIELHRRVNISTNDILYTQKRDTISSLTSWCFRKNIKQCMSTSQIYEKKNEQKKKAFLCRPSSRGNFDRLIRRAFFFYIFTFFFFTQVKQIESSLAIVALGEVYFLCIFFSSLSMCVLDECVLIEMPPFLHIV